MWGVVLGVLLGIVLTLLGINLLRTRVQPQVIIQDVPVDQYIYSPYYWGLGGVLGPWGYGGYGSGGYSGGIAHHGGHGGGHGGGGHGH